MKEKIIEFVNKTGIIVGDKIENPEVCTLFKY